MKKKVKKQIKQEHKGTKITEWQREAEKEIKETEQEEIEMVLGNLEEIRKNFTQPIVEGILGGKKNANQ